MTEQQTRPLLHYCKKSLYLHGHPRLNKKIWRELVPKYERERERE